MPRLEHERIVVYWLYISKFSYASQQVNHLVRASVQKKKKKSPVFVCLECSYDPKEISLGKVPLAGC